MSELTEQNTQRRRESCCKTTPPHPAFLTKWRSARYARPHWRPFIESPKTWPTSSWLVENGRRIIRDTALPIMCTATPKVWTGAGPLISCRAHHAKSGLGLKPGSSSARGCNLILADIYGGSQRLLRDGFLPPELVYANPGFSPPPAAASNVASRGLSASARV